MNKTLLVVKQIMVVVALSFFGTNSTAQDVPFNCDFNAYLFQYNDVYAIVLASGIAIIVARDITTGNINGAGYNSKDG